MGEREIVVSVLMLAYNHEKYIRQAIEGVLMQKTKYPFELIIHDDASTDKTASIIKEYEIDNPNVIRVIYQKSNTYSKGVRPFRDFMIPMVRGRYIAICEGDDYWTDATKLEKQVDFLESHNDYSMAMHNAWQYDEKKGSKVLLDTFPQSGTYGLRDQVLAGLGTKFPATASYILRTEYWHDLPSEFLDGVVGDYPIRVYYSSRGNVYYDESPMSVYRYSSNGSFTEKITTDVEKYVSYVDEMIGLYNAYNAFLDYEFSDIYTRKILSDYLGLASIVNDADLLNNKKNIDSDVFKKYVDILSPTEIEGELLEFVKSKDAIWLYGTSGLAMKIAKKLENKGIEIKGFVVSDGYSKIDVFEGKKVIYLSELKGNCNSYGIVLAVQPINEIGIINNLRANGFMDYYSFFE